jgi:hypothetical protein
MRALEGLLEKQGRTEAGMFRFTIRELVLLTLVVALALSWWIDRTRLAAEFESASNRAAVLEAVVDSAGWEVRHDMKGNRISQIHISRKGN